MHMHTCTHTHTHTCTYMHIHTHTYAYMHAQVRLFRAPVHAHAHTCTYMHMYMHTYMHMHMPSQVRLFRAPCVASGAPSRVGRSHCERVVDVKFTAGSSGAVSVGAYDRCEYTPCAWSTCIHAYVSMHT